MPSSLVPCQELTLLSFPPAGLLLVVAVLLLSGASARSTYRTYSTSKFPSKPKLTFSKSKVVKKSVEPVVLSAQITLDQEPVLDEATPGGAAGSGTLLLDVEKGLVKFCVAYTGLSGDLMQMHFHNGTVGVNGPVIQTICGMPQPALVGPCKGTSGFISSTWKVSKEVVGLLLTESVYFNLHTELNAGGEIRGQIIPEVASF